ILLNCVGHIHQLEDRIIPLEKKLMFTIWLLRKPESFLAAGDRFGLPKSSGYKIFRPIIMELGRLTPQFIRWPNMQSVFEARSRGITGVVGAIDGCHIAIRQPIRNPIDFYNRKGFHYIVLQ
uniref:Nuclease HARBI1 n=1 Tax=Diabrotica virgifera virgifera TaxID=50390 RepID=A0A6P7GYX9_DIAVI